MRFNLLPLVLAALPVAVSGRGTLGFSLGNKNPDKSCKTTDDYKKDFDALKELSTLVRTYSASDCHTATNIMPAAKEKGFQVVLAVWPDYDQSFHEDFNVLKKVVPGNEGNIHSITVGSEVLYRNNISAEKLLKRINQVKNEFPKVKVGTADSWNKFADGTADPLIQGGVDYFLGNAFSYWQGTPIDTATNTYFDDTAQAMEHIQKLAGGSDKVYFATGETGWPTTGGTDYEAAKAGTQNAEQFYKQGVCGMLAWGLDVFYFEAFDETWKPTSIGDNGKPQDETHWGMFHADRSKKFDTTCPE